MSTKKLTAQDVLDFLQSLSSEDLSKQFIVYDYQTGWFTPATEIKIVESDGGELYGGGTLEKGMVYIVAD